ncbi:hypothetical protein ES703_29278 [subsurface metagenome]
MPAEVRLSLKEFDELIEKVEAGGGDAEELKKRRAEVANSKWLAKVAGRPLGEEEHIAELRSQSPIERGTDLECLVCHTRVEELISGTCESCFREWALTVERR